MSQKHRCCILECTSPDNTKLFRFPSNNDLRAIWRRIIRPHNPDLYRSSARDLSVLAQRNVCERHFELRYIRNSRREGISIPTLFTQEEIASRTPTHPIELKMENLDPPWVLDTSTDVEGNQSALSLMIMDIRHDHSYYLTKRLILESSLAPDSPVSEELNVVPTSSDDFDVEQIWKLCRSNRLRAPRQRRRRQKATSDGRSAARQVDTQQPRSEPHTPLITASGICPGAGNSNVSGDQSENQIAVSDHCESQPAVDIIVEDAVDDSQYLAGVDTLTGADDDCYNISDDDCQAVDDDSSFYHNLSKLSDDKDDMEMDPHNLDENEDLHEGFKCNFCSGEIKGYRYTCVQCADYDLCGSCEARGAHCLHYVLRIPRPKPYTEIQPLLLEIRRLLSGAHNDVLWAQVDEIKEEDEESNEEVMLMSDDDPLDIDCVPVTPTLSETEDNVPEMSTRTTKSHGNRQVNNDMDTVPEVTMQPQIKSHLLDALHTYTRHKQTVTVDKRSAASTSSPQSASPRLIASNRNTLLTRPQAIDKTRTRASESSQYTASTSLAADGNTLLTIESSPQAIDNTTTPASESSQYTASTFFASDGNTYLTIESSPQASDNTRTPASESSQYTASTRLAADGNTLLTIESSPQEFDKTRTPVSVSSPYPVLTRLAPQRNERPLLKFGPSFQAIDRTRTPASESSQYTASTRLAAVGNTVFTIESSPQAIDNTRTPVSESSLFTASTSFSSDGNTVLTIATNVEDTDSTSRSVPSTSTRQGEIEDIRQISEFHPVYPSTSITPVDTETTSNKITITGDSRLQVPMATKRKYSDIIEASKPSQMVLLKGSKKFIVVPSILERDLK